MAGRASHLVLLAVFSALCMTFTSHHHGVVDHLGVVSHLDDLHDLGYPQHLSSVDRHGDLPHLCLDLVHQLVIADHLAVTDHVGVKRAPGS